MGHAEVTQAPGQTGEDAAGGIPARRAAGQAPVARLQRLSVHPLARIQSGQGDDGGGDQGDEHEHALEKVRPADGAEAAQEGVGDDDHRSEDHGAGGVYPQHGVEQGAAGLDAAGGVNGVGQEEDHRAQDLQGLVPAEEAVGEILGNGDGILRRNGEAAEPLGYQDPAQRLAQGQAHGGPDLHQTGEVQSAGKTHEHPGAHIRSAGGKSGDQTAHLAVAQEIRLLALVPVLQEEIQADAQHTEQIEDKNDQFCVIQCRCLLLTNKYLLIYNISKDFRCGDYKRNR